VSNSLKFTQSGFVGAKASLVDGLPRLVVDIGSGLTTERIAIALHSRRRSLSFTERVLERHFVAVAAQR
jgi:hypothetical protein